jgi:hypothetical protein
VQPRFYVARHDRVLHLLDAREQLRVNLLKPPAEAGEGAGVRLYRGTAEILQEVVMEMEAVEAGLTREDLIEITEVVVDKMGKGLRWVHALSWLALSTSDA